MSRITLGRRRSIRRLLEAAGVVLALASPAGAQGLTPPLSDDVRWDAWLGCWTPLVPATPMARPGDQVCFVPAQGTSAVDVVTVVGGKIVSREHIEATGERRRTETDGCPGWEKAEWSSDRRRVYLTSETSCPNSQTRRSSGLFAMSSKGVWLHIVGVTVGEDTGVRVLGQRPSVLTDSPQEIASLLQGAGRQATNAARLAASAPISTREIIEASRHLSAAVVEAWLGSIEQVLTIDAQRLITLADAGAPGRVIDMVVALAYPQAFSIKPSATSRGALAVGGGGFGDVGRIDSAGLTAVGDCGSYGDRFSVYGWDPCSLYGSLSGYSFDRFGVSPYGAAPFGSWYLGSQPPVILLVPSGADDTSHGQVVKGRGYVAGSDATSGTAGTATPSDGSNTMSTPDSSNAGGGSSSTSGNERTAKPR